MMYLFKYCGHVLYYDAIVRYDWKAETIAPSKEKAKANLQYQYKKKHGFARDAQIYLTDEVDGPYPIRDRYDHSDYPEEIRYSEKIIKDQNILKQSQPVVEQLTFDMFSNGR